MIIKDLENLKKKMLFLVVIIFLAISIFRILNNFNNYEQTKKITKNGIYKETNYIYNSQINLISRSFKNRLESILEQQIIQDAIKTKNMISLYDTSFKRFKAIQKDFPRLDKMKYYFPDTNEILIIDNDGKFTKTIKAKQKVPDKHLDSIKMGFIQDIYDKNRILYQVAVPYKQNGKVVAVIKLEICVKGILSKLDHFFKASRKNDVFIGFLFHKNPESQEKIENNTNLKNCIILSTNNIVNDIVKTIDLTKQGQDVVFNNTNYFIFFDKTSLKNYQGKHVGVIFYAFDTTKLEKNLFNYMLQATIQPAFGMLILVALLTWLFNYIIKQSRINQTKITSIVNNQNAIIVVTNGKKIIQANKSFFNFFNISNLEQFTNKYDCICDKFEQKDGYIQKQMGDLNWLEYILQYSSKNNKVEIYDTKGNLHIFQLHANKILENEDKEYIISFDDITELENINKNLKKVVDEKTKSLQEINQKLESKITETISELRVKDQHMIQQSRLAQMGEMISMIAHQWRQPLAAISSTSTGISLKAKLNKLDNKMAIELADKISKYSSHLSLTIDDFREFFKVNKEKKETTYNQLIQGVLDIIEISISNKNITLVKDLDSDVIFTTYPNELKQVILNLIKNAEDVLIEKEIKNPKITIETRGNVLTVRDNGGGISNNIIDKIFDPYFSTKTKKDGTGLGLYMSKTITQERCGGKLLVSNDEEGAVFSIILHKDVDNG